MKIEKIKPNVVTYKLTPSREDREYLMYTQARFEFDCDNGIVNINSDAGDYSYRWGYNEHENFMRLMSRINSDYLLNKISDRTVLDLEASKKETVENVINWDGYDYSELKSFADEINDIYADNADEFFYKVDHILPGGMVYDCIAIVKRFPRSAELICDLFTKYIQPQIKKDFQL